MAPPYEQNLFHPKLPLSQRSPVSIPLVLSWPDVCSQAALRWLKRTDGKGLCGMCTRSNTRNMHVCTGHGGGTGCSGDPGLLSQNLKMSFFSLPFSRCVQPPQYETDAPTSHVTEDKHGLRSEKVRNLGVFFFFFFCCNWISVAYCASD